MKKLTVPQILIYVGIFLFFACPIYQGVDYAIHNKPGDGLRIYGDNPVFRNILGVKTIECVLFKGIGWEEIGNSLQTTPWMQKIGFSKTIRWDYYSERNSRGSNSSSSEVFWIITLRWFIKLAIPAIFIIPGLILRQKQETN